MPCRSIVTRSPSMAGGPPRRAQRRSRAGGRAGVCISSSLTERPGQCDLQPVVARNGDDRPHLHDGVEGDGAAVLAARDVDLGLGDRVELGVDDGAGVEVRQRLAQRLGTQRAGAAHAGLEHLARHLAGPETGHPDLLGQCAHHVAERSIELGLVDLHTQADEVPLHWLGCRTHHERITLPAVPRPGRTVRRGGGDGRGGQETAQNMKFMAPSTDRPTAASPSHVDTAGGLHLRGRGPATAEAHEVDAREARASRSAPPRRPPGGPARLDGDA